MREYVRNQKTVVERKYGLIYSRDSFEKCNL